MDTSTSGSRYCLMVIALAVWFALIGQLVLILQHPPASVAETIIRYFSFFTILTNILIAVCVSSLLLRKPGGWLNFFSRPSVQTALFVYITVVGLVYNVILRQLWDPQGMQKIVDELLHTGIPLLYIFYWSCCTDKRSLTWKNIPAWLIYPAAYAVYTIARGAIVNYYPYPFMDVNALGYRQVFINSGVLVLVFLFFAVIPVLIAKMNRAKTVHLFVCLFVCFHMSSSFTPPPAPKYIVKYLPAANFRLDGKLDDKQWAGCVVIKDLMSPWVPGAEDHTVFRAFHDDKFFYFSFVVKDTSPVVTKYVNEETVGGNDRVEFFFSQTAALKQYYGFEMDPQGKTLDYVAGADHHFDFGWNMEELNIKTDRHPGGYELEGRLPLSFFEKMAIPGIKPLSVHGGVFRADFYDYSMQAVNWFSWLKPDSPTPNFHIPSSFGIFVFEEK